MAYVAPVPPAAKAARAAKNLIKLAETGPRMATQVSLELDGLGVQQLRTVVMNLWMTLAQKGTRDAQ